MAACRENGENEMKMKITKINGSCGINAGNSAGEKWHGENNHQRASSRAFAAA
jgi:hypothetical protein